MQALAERGGGRDTDNMSRRCILFLPALGTALLGLVGDAYGQAAGRVSPEQREVAMIIDALRDTRADPPDACVSALDDLHATENQLQTLTGNLLDDNETTPVQRQTAGEISIGRDVLASDMDQTVSTCRDTADRACGSVTAGPAAATCGRLREAEAALENHRP